MNSDLMVIYFAAAILCFAYAAVIASFTVGWFRLPGRSLPGGTSAITATVIVAARNEEADLGSCLKAIADQDYPRAFFEVIVVDDHSSDGTAEVARKIITGYPSLRIKLLTLENGLEGKKAAISLAIKSAVGEWIVTTDADCRMDKFWLTTLMQFAGDESLQMLLAPVVFNREKSVFGQLQELEFMSLMASSAGAAGIGLPVMCNGANLAYRKKTFMELQGYTGDEIFASGDDMFLMMKIRKTFGSKAIRFVKLTAAIVTTPPAASLTEFANQRLRWVSKSRGYRDAWVLFTSALVFAFSLSTIISIFLWILGLIWPILPVAFLSVKILVDFPLMAAFARFAERSRLMLWYVPLQVIYVFYVTLFGVLGNVLHYRWKGRELK